MKSEYTLRQKENFAKMLENPKISPALKREWEAGNYRQVLQTLKDDELILKQVDPRLLAVAEHYLNYEEPPPKPTIDLLP